MKKTKKEAEEAEREKGRERGRGGVGEISKKTDCKT